MSSHIDRMKDEYKELEIKIDALTDFIRTNDLFKSLSESDQILMVQQLGFMGAYLRTLNQRIWSDVGKDNSLTPSNQS